MHFYVCSSPSPFRLFFLPFLFLSFFLFEIGIASGAGLLLDIDVHATTISGQTRVEGLEMPFQFARLQTTDDDDEACQDETRLRELGTVRVGIRSSYALSFRSGLFFFFTSGSDMWVLFVLVLVLVLVLMLLVLLVFIVVVVVVGWNRYKSSG